MPTKRQFPKSVSTKVFGHPLRVGLYARVSTQDQQTLPLQIRAMSEYVEIVSRSQMPIPVAVSSARHDAGVQEHNRIADKQVLLAGLSQAVQGFAPLDYVPRELENLKAQSRGEELFNKSFLSATLEKEFARSQYSVVHIASHGQFGHDINKTFVLTYDGKLTLDGFQSQYGILGITANGPSLSNLRSGN